MKFIIYSKQNCTYCIQAKNLLTLKGLEFEERKIDEDPARLSELKELVPNVTKVPQIFAYKQVGEHTSEWRHIGGFDQLRDKISDYTD